MTSTTTIRPRPPKAKWCHPAKWAHKLATGELIVSAGMPRSGSTMLFNILRVILTKRWGGALSSGWEGNLDTLSYGKVYLIKTHTLGLYGSLNPRHLFYTYRDVRTAAVSAHRRFALEITLSWVRDQIEEYQRAKGLCDLCIRYEDLVVDPEPFIGRIAGVLRVEVDPTAVAAEVASLAPPEHGETPSPVTALHPEHRTCTADDDWREAIPGDLLREINAAFGWWFAECGYPTD